MGELYAMDTNDHSKMTNTEVWQVGGVTQSKKKVVTINTEPQSHQHPDTARTTLPQWLLGAPLIPLIINVS